MADDAGPSGWVTLKDALTTFARAEHGTQGQRQIRPLHWHVACRLVVEGGFHPDEVVPRPPFTVRTKGGVALLDYDPSSQRSGERTILGGLKTKTVDVVVTKPDIGPCVAVSIKGTLNAFRNLTNRMEEAAGDCTNLHLAYPALVYAFWHVMRANREGAVLAGSEKILGPPGSAVKAADIAIDSAGDPSSFIRRYEFAMEGLTGRAGLRDESSRYEAIGLTLASVEPPTLGEIHSSFPAADSPLSMTKMFETIYRQYDLRFVYQAPDLSSRTRRLEWSRDSPALNVAGTADFEPRLAG